MTTTNEIRERLAEFTGGLRYTRWNPSFPLQVLTEGTTYLLQSANAAWLLDAIASHQSQLRNEPFQVWQLRPANGHWELSCGDGNDEPGDPGRLLRQAMPGADFPLEEGIKLYAIQDADGVTVILLPGEY